MLGKPKITIKNFTGMGDNGIFFLQGMKPVMKGGESVLTPDMRSSLIVSEDTALFSGLDSIIQSFTSAGLDGTYTFPYVCGITGGKIFSIQPLASNYLGLIHTVATSGDISASSYPGILSSINENLLYTNACYLGIGYKRKATGADATSVTVTGTDWTALGISATAGSNKIFNVTQKKTYTVTSVSGSGNITLNFASQSPAPATNDYIMVFKDDFQLLENGLSTQDQHFAGQLSPANWVRTLLLFGSNYYILNGNYIATLNINESTYSATTKQLPYKTQAMCFNINADRMLIGGLYNNAGKIMLWDGYSSGFTNIIETAVPPSAIYPYGSGWAVAIGTAVYYTDGYSLKKLFVIPDTNEYSTSFSLNSPIAVVNDDIYFSHSSTSNLTERSHSGIYKWNASYGLQYTPLYNGAGYPRSGGSICVMPDRSSANVYISGGDSLATKTAFIGSITNLAASKCGAKFYIKLPQKINFSIIELNLRSYSYRNSITSTPVTVTVNYGFGHNVPYQIISGNEANTTTTIKNTSYTTAKCNIGQKVLLINGDAAGEYSYITDIDDQGTANEVITVSPAFTVAPNTSGYDIRVEDLYGAGSKSYEAHTGGQDMNFNIPTIYSDKLFVEVMFDSGAGSARVDLHAINIY